MKGILKLTAESTFALASNTSTSMTHADCFLVFSDEVEDMTLEGVDDAQRKELLQTIKRFEWEAEQGSVTYCQSLGVYLVGLGECKDFSAAVLMNAVASLMKNALSAHMKTLSIFVRHELIDDPITVGKSIALGYHLGNYTFDLYKKKKSGKPVEQMHIRVVGEAGPDTLEQIEQGTEIGEWSAAGVYLARDLVNQPANAMNPSELARVAQRIADESGGSVSVKVLERKECEELGMGAYLGVTAGSDAPPKFIVLHYKPKEALSNVKKICFVGKSITFDTGGLSLKPPSAMEDMKIDMAGGAAVLGLFETLALMSREGDLEVEYEVYGVLAACENMPSGGAMRPGDVVRGMSGETIEVLNTDAEGRLTLADALHYAQTKLKPDYLIDIATLTGASMVALGTDIAGLFSNKKKFGEQLTRVAQSEGDECWMMPLHMGYRENLKSHIADIANITKDRYGGAITAAVFLSDFVDKDIPWAHIDIAGPSFAAKAGKGIKAEGASGWGVLTFLGLLCESEIESE